MENNKFEIIELLVDDMNLLHGVEAMSLVHDPAIETDFIHFHKEFNSSFSKIDEEKRLVTGPALIPHKMILRAHEEEGQPIQYFYVYFSKDTIQKTSQRFLQNGNQNNSTLEHAVKLEGISVVESWIIASKENDKSNLFGFDLPVGTWMLTSYIENDDVWEKIKSGEVKGYSIEGRYTDKVLQASSEPIITAEEILNAPIEDLTNTNRYGVPNDLVGTDEEKQLLQNIIDILSLFDDEQI